MRSYILLYVNGKEHRVRGADAFLPLTDYLRYGISACGTKVVCAEGDCGACTVAIGRVEGNQLTYRPLNGCIQYIYQLDCAHVITVEGMKYDEDLNPIQEAMVQMHGAQCGYCTPGFIVAMCSMLDEYGARQPERATVKECLSGNLCRCTGYVSIIESALTADTSKFIDFNKQYPPEAMVRSLQQLCKEPVLIEQDGRFICCPAELSGALKFKKEHPDAVIISGGTDVSVNMNKRGLTPRAILSTGNIQGLDELRQEGDALVIGARVSLRSLERYVKELVPSWHKVLFVFGSPQIRFAGTLAGNIANASPIADNLPFLFVTDAEIEVAGAGATRRIKINELYEGYKMLRMKPQEIITKIIVKLPKDTDNIKLYKVSRREHLDISTFTAAIKMTMNGDNIGTCAIAYGGVGPVVLRLPNTEAFLAGKPFNLDTFRSAGAIARDEITPISDVRGSRDFRYQLAENILAKFYFETVGGKEPVCR
ncbi:MAG TPA: FAD binding domain-containing protein [Planktothrix sp.]|jgi:xanthine dehydrogenase small subunit